jgi:multidrug efflux pump subunit AcrA (membrane-fusion protein)
MEKKLRNLLILFFALMALFTVVSRAAASVMVAKVQTDTTKEGELTYKLSGSGILKENGEKYLEVYEGLKIGKLYIEKGSQVEKGDTLFAYDVKQLKEKKSELDKELKKLKLQSDKTGLTDKNPDSSLEVEAAVLAKEGAGEDLTSAQKNLSDTKTNIKKVKQEAYKQAVLAYKEAEGLRETEENNAERAVEDADSDYQEIMKPEVTLRAKVDNYKNAVSEGNMDLISKAGSEIYDFYYNGGYKEHLEEKDSAVESLNRAQEDLAAVKAKWDKAINVWDQYDSEESVQRAYYAQVAAREEELKNAGRVIADAQKKLDKITEKENLLTNALNNYQNDIKDHLSENQEGTYFNLYQVLYDNLKIDETKISAAKTKLARAKEDRKQINLGWEEKIKTTASKKEELLKDLQEINEGTYDYTEDLKDAEKGVKEAKRALQNAELSLSKAMENERITRENNQVKDKSQALDLELSKVDIDTKKKEISKINDLITRKGKVTAPVNGVIEKNELLQGSTLTGQEKITIAAGGYELLIKAGKEDMKHFAVGDELQIETGTSGEKITSQIENIELPDQDDNVSFTALLPEGDYKNGGSLSYEISKDSENYRSCIPLQALRQDSMGTYVLIIKEKESVLGKEESAFRLNVTLLSQDTDTAAIEASLSGEDLVITGSNKNIKEGDRVRIYEAE